MSKNYKEILAELESSIEELNQKGIFIEPLNDSFKELKRHSSNIEKVENNIEAIRIEVIDRIKDELEENKKAGKFSILGFYIGFIALAVTVATIVLNYQSNKKLNDKLLNTIGISDNNKDNYKESYIITIAEKLYEIEKSIHNLTYNITEFDNNYIPKNNEFIIENHPVGYNKHTIFKDGKDSIQICALYSREDEYNGKLYPISIIQVYKNGNSFGTYNLKENVQITGQINKNNYDFSNKALIVTEKDTLVFFNKYKLFVERIYRRKSEILKIADDKDAVLIKIIE